MSKIKRTKGETTLSLLLSFLFCPLCCLSFCPFSFAHCVVSPFVLFILPIKKKDKRRDNTMVKRKRTKGETTQWSKEKDKRRDNTMGCLSFCLFYFAHCVVSPFVLFLLLIVLSLLLSFLFCPLCCLSF
jgi:hypothetical protein